MSVGLRDSPAATRQSDPSLCSMTRRGWLIGIAAAAAVSGCAVIPPDPASTASGERPAADPSEWTGRFSAVYRVPGAAGDEQSASGRFRLLQRAGQTLLELSSPIGQMIAQAQADAQGARLTDNQGRSHQAPSVELLTEQLFGWRVPVQRLPAWLQGRFGSAGTVNPGNQWAGHESGWDIRVDGWLDDRVVRTLQLSWPGQGVAADRRLRLRLVVDSAS